MIAYVDSSVLLRVALGQANALPQWRRIDRGVSSALITTESLPTLDRLRLTAGLRMPKSLYGARQFLTRLLRGLSANATPRYRAAPSAAPPHRAALAIRPK